MRYFSRRYAKQQGMPHCVGIMNEKYELATGGMNMVKVVKVVHTSLRKYVTSHLSPTRD